MMLAEVLLGDDDALSKGLGQGLLKALGNGVGLEGGVKEVEGGDRRWRWGLTMLRSTGSSTSKSIARGR